MNVSFTSFSLNLKLSIPKMINVILLNSKGSELAGVFESNSMENPKKFVREFVTGLLLVTIVHSENNLLLAQESSKVDVGSWMVLSLDNELSERWSIPVVGILCYENVVERTEFGFLRSGISYKVNENTEVTFGAAYVDSQPLYHHEFESLTTQFWLYEEFAFKSNTSFSHRLRLENRWITKPDETSFNLRFRYRFAYQKQLGQSFFLKCTTEPFFNFDKLHVDENRFFFGIGKKISKELTMEIGYFKTHVRKDNYDRIRIALHLKTAFLKKNAEDVTEQKINTFLK